MSCFFQPS